MRAHSSRGDRWIRRWLAAGLALVATSVSASSLLIDNVTVISPERAEPLADAWVLIDDGRIRSVGHGDPPKPAAREATPRVLDGGGRFLTPGLIDSHVHLASIPGLPIPLPASLRRLAAAYERQAPRSYLFHGFTTLIDLNVVDRGALDRFTAAPAHPDVFDCGGALALADGYPMVFLPPAVRYTLYRNFIVDPEATPPAGVDPTHHTPGAAVARVAEGGGICTKSFAEDGFGDARIWPSPDADLVTAVVQASHEHGLTATLHANAFEAWGIGVEAGVDVLVHGMWNWDGQEAETGLPAAIRQRLDQVLEAGIGVMPTAQVIAGLRDLFDPDYLDDPAFARVMPASLVPWYRSEAARGFATSLQQDDFGGAPDAVIRQRFALVLDQGRRVTAYLAAEKGRLLLGSDTPSGPTYANPPGLNGYREMLALAEAGATPRQILDAATRANAEAFGLDDRYGTVTPGRIAHLLLLDEDPLISAEAWDSIHTVVLAGRPIERSTLAAGD